VLEQVVRQQAARSFAQRLRMSSPAAPPGRTKCAGDEAARCCETAGGVRGHALAPDHDQERKELMRVLVTWGSKLGVTEGIARIVAASLQEARIDVELHAAGEVRSVRGFDAVIVGGAIYANRWHRDARRFVARHLSDLQRIPVWMFSSGPLDDSAARAKIPPVTQVAVLMERVGALGHATFGGRLAPDAKGFPASAMAKKLAGDWRDPDRIRSWAAEIAKQLPSAKPAAPVIHPARSIRRAVAHAALGAAACAAVMAGALAAAGPRVAIVLHAIAAPLIFAAIARHYFAARGARSPLPVAIAFTAIAAALDLGIVAGLIQRSAALLGSIAGAWLPLALIFLTTWACGAIMSTLPWPKPAPAAPQAT
jgi:menaquinone-dependent protoporphyrinogen oxidase